MRTFLILLLTLMATACSHQTTLKNSQGQSLANALVKFEGNQSGTMQLEKDGVMYQGTWVATQLDERAQIAKMYGVHSKRYQDYTLGRAAYLRKAEATLSSPQGKQMACTFNYRGTQANGACRSASEVFAFVASE